MLTWYDQYGRKDLPWQRNQNPYYIWISEIMLQQTRVETVIPYFESFIQRFPDVMTLSNASVDEVLHHWTGLGYYARARNLHKAARVLCEQFEGNFPTQLEDAMQLPGIGRSTAAAILALSFNQSHAILDGNVKRVLARYFAISGWPGNHQVQQLLWKHAESLVPQKRVANYTQAMMDLGATICTRTNPLCEQCPIQKSCRAHLHQLQHELPSAKPSRKLPERKIYVAIVKKEDHSVWLEKRPPTGIWGGLYSYPEFSNLKELKTWGAHYSNHSLTKLPLITHTFSHFHLTMYPYLISVIDAPNSVMEDDLGLWYKLNQQKIGLAAPVKKSLEQLFKKEQSHDAHGAMCETR